MTSFFGDYGLESAFIRWLYDSGGDAMPGDFRQTAPGLQLDDTAFRNVVFFLIDHDLIQERAVGRTGRLTRDMPMIVRISAAGRRCVRSYGSNVGEWLHFDRSTGGASSTTQNFAANIGTMIGGQVGLAGGEVDQAALGGQNTNSVTGKSPIAEPVDTLASKVETLLARARDTADDLALDSHRSEELEDTVTVARSALSTFGAEIEPMRGWLRKRLRRIARYLNDARRTDDLDDEFDSLIAGLSRVLVEHRNPRPDVVNRPASTPQGGPARDLAARSGGYRSSMVDTATLQTAYLNWLAEKRDIVPDQFADESEQRVGELVEGTQLTDLVHDLIDDGFVESSLKGGAWGIEESDLPLRVRLTRLGQQVVRRHAGRVDQWRDTQQSPPAGSQTFNITTGNITDSQFGVGGRDVQQAQGAAVEGTPRERLAQLLEQVRDQTDTFNQLDDAERDQLRDEAEDGATAARALESGDDPEVVPAKARRRGTKVMEFLEKAAAGATGSLAANQLLVALDPLLLP